MPGVPTLAVPQKQRLKRVFVVWALLQLLIGTLWLSRVTAQIGQTYGGFIWTHDPTAAEAFWVAPDLWRSQAPSPLRLRVLDQIISIDGMSPWSFGQVYEQSTVGQHVSYVVLRGARELTIVEPVQVFTWDAFVLSHGLLYTAGLTYVLAGYLLLSGTARKDLALFSFALLAAAGAWFSHSEVAGIHRPYVGHGMVEFLLYTPAMPLTGALLLHFGMLFPVPSRLVLRVPRLPVLVYGLAVTAMLAYTATLNTSAARLHSWALLMMYAMAAVGILSVFLRSTIAYLRARHQSASIQREVLEAVTGTWLLGAAIFVVLGVIPLYFLGFSVVPFEILITLAALFPLALVYALRNVELIQRLHQEALLNRQYSDKFEELQNLRERTLHEVADALHDQVIPELRGLQFASTALSRALQDGHNDSLAGDARYIADSLDTLSARARAIVDGAKPVDWDETDLCQALHWLASSFDRSNQGLEVRLECQVGQEDPAAAKDAIYWTAWAALSNVQNHAHASRVDLQVRSSAQAMQLVITDNGRGFDLSQVGQQAHRRQLGVSNMVQRAAQVGGSLDIETAPGRGTRITMTIPRVQPPAGSLAAASTTGLSPERIG